MEQESEESEVRGFGKFFEVSRLLSEAQKNHGIAHQNYTEYILERMDIALATCSELQFRLQGFPDMQEYLSSLEVLITQIRFIYHKWFDYEAVLDLNSIPSTEYQARSAHSAGVIRPAFEISREQLEYLSSLGFKWIEIAALVGVSRMRIYRCVQCSEVYLLWYSRRHVDYGLLNDQHSKVGDEALESPIIDIRRDLPYSGVSIVHGSLRSRGVTVTRECVSEFTEVY